MPRFPFLHFPALYFSCAAFSCLAFSVAPMSSLSWKGFTEQVRFKAGMNELYSFSVPRILSVHFAKTSAFTAFAAA